MTDTFYAGKDYSPRAPVPMTNFKRVEQFMRSFEQEVAVTANFPSKTVQELRYELIREELGELFDAMQDQNIVEVGDALTDLLYVVYGAGHAYGIDLDKCFAEVHRSNMTKLGDDGKPIRRADGKVMKSSNYEPPKLAPIILGDADEEV